VLYYITFRVNIFLNIMERLRIFIILQVFRGSMRRVLSKWKIGVVNERLSERIEKFKRVLRGVTPEKTSPFRSVEIAKPRCISRIRVVNYHKRSKSKRNDLSAFRSQARNCSKSPFRSQEDFEFIKDEEKQLEEFGEIADKKRVQERNEIAVVSCVYSNSGFSHFFQS